MLKKIILSALVAAAVALMPSMAHAYGAAHVGYTHVGPNGVYHTGETAVRGPAGNTYVGGHTTGATYGGAYHSSYGGSTSGGGAYGGYHYNAGYSGAGGVRYGGTTTGGAYGYGYVR
jgi:hypothetical protein